MSLPEQLGECEQIPQIFKDGHQEARSPNSLVSKKFTLATASRRAPLQGSDPMNKK
jgi:hypothetical protein